MMTSNGFQNYILDWYSRYGRTKLPWRQTTEPYHILVSELMLQQTQVERVIPKYLRFLQTFPTIEALAQASLADVLRLWQGLGYNRRAKFLHQTAQAVHITSNNTFPQTLPALISLPGIGPYTASAIATFAFNQPVTVIETNIRAVFLYHFFPQAEKIGDQELLPLITASLYTSNPRLWYSALMDYGSVLKKLVKNPTQKSKHFTKQSSFIHSPRRVRGEIIRYLSINQNGVLTEIQNTIQGNKEYFLPALQQLEKEGLILRDGDVYRLGK